MNIEKFTNKSREALMNAQHYAEEANNTELRPLHLLAALLDDPESLVSSILEKLGVNRELFRNQVSGAMRELPHIEGNNMQQVSMSREFSTMLNAAMKKAGEMGDEYVSAEHLLLALASSGGRAAELLGNVGISADKILKNIICFK